LSLQEKDESAKTSGWKIIYMTKPAQLMAALVLCKYNMSYVRIVLLFVLNGGLSSCEAGDGYAEG